MPSKANAPSFGPNPAKAPKIIGTATSATMTEARLVMISANRARIMQNPQKESMDKSPFVYLPN